MPKDLQNFLSNTPPPSNFQPAFQGLPAMDALSESGKVLQALQQSGLALFPSDTIWGIGCDATDPVAVQRIFNLTNHAYDTGLTILVSGVEMLREYVKTLHPRIETLLLYHQRPLTVLYDSPVNLPRRLLDADGCIAVRITFDPFCRQIIEDFGKPVVCTPAHVNGADMPTHFGTISSEILQGVDYVVRYRQKDKNMNPPAVMVRLSDEGELKVIRE